jgi:nucleotide-binding universal stress UspA family protein
MMFAPKTLLVPTDFSEYSDKALQLGLDIAKQYLLGSVAEKVGRQSKCPVLMAKN